jgi:hypothetical protein
VFLALTPVFECGRIVLAAHAGAAMRVFIVALAEYARVKEVVREEVAQPVDAAARCPRLLAVFVQAMIGDDTAIRLAVNALPKQ